MESKMIKSVDGHIYLRKYVLGYMIVRKYGLMVKFLGIHKGIPG